MASKMTRSKAKQSHLCKNVDEETEETDKILNNYMIIIDDLKRKLEEQEKLNKILLKEQKTNLSEYESELERYCKENYMLKKKICEEEEKSKKFEEVIHKIANENSILLEEHEEYENTYQLTQLKEQLHAKTTEYKKLKLRYSELLLETQKTRYIKKASKKLNNLNRKRKSNKVLRKKIRKLNAQIKKQVLINNILRKEIGKRNDIVTGIKEESEKILLIIQEYENRLQDQEKLTCKMEYLETQLRKLQNIIDKKISITHEDKFEHRKGEEEEITPGTNKKPKKQRNVLMYSDGLGKDMGYLIKKNLPASYAINNICKPNASIKEILQNDVIQAQEKEDIIVLTIGNFSTIQRHTENFISNISKMIIQANKNCNKLIITSLLYERGQREENNIIFNINTKLYNLASIYDNVIFIEVNSLQYYKSAFKKELAKHIALTCQYNINKNVITLVDNTNDTSQNYFCEDFLEKRHLNGRN